MAKYAINTLRNGKLQTGIEAIFPDNKTAIHAAREWSKLSQVKKGDTVLVTQFVKLQNDVLPKDLFKWTVS